MSELPHQEEVIFDAAARLPPEERTAYLQQACVDDAALRQRVELLLSAYERGKNFMEEPAADASGLTALPREKAGDIIGRYKLLQEIGEGGCGTVYMAEQLEPVRRRVALKVIKLGMDTKNVIARFEAERQALALMDHPNIARVFDAGATETGRPFFVMELVRGTKITDFCDSGNISTKDRLRLFIEVCQAIQHAHQKGVIHRDIKPSNVLVTLRDGVPVPKIIDFGIAKATTGEQLTDKTVFTAFEQFVGTPAYMSPEQAEMNELGIDTRSDIYSLGVLLYELLTGTTPFDGRELRRAGLDEIRRIIREDEPLRPSTRLSTLAAASLTEVARQRNSEPGKLSSLFRGELDWIVMKALEKDRARRYDTANALAEDLQRYLADEPVLACPPSALYRFEKALRRHKAAFFTAALTLVLLVAGIIASTTEAVRARRAEREQARLRQQAQQATEELRRNLYAAEMNMANQVLDLNNGIRRIAGIVSKWTNAPELRGWEWFYLNSLCHREDLTLAGHHQKVNSLAASPDGRQLAAAYQDGTVRVFDILDGKEAAVLGDGLNPISSVVWSPDGLQLACSELDRIEIWQPAAKKKLRVMTGEGIDGLQAVAWSHDGKKLCAAGDSKAIGIWNAATGELIAKLEGHRAPVLCLAWSPDDSQLASSSRDGTVRIWNPASAKEALPPLQHADSVNSVSWSPDGRELASGCVDNLARVWNARSGELEQAFRAQPTVVSAVAWRPGTQRLATASSHDVTVNLYDLTVSNKIPIAMRGHISPALCLAWSPDGSWLASGDDSGDVKIWNPDADDAQSMIAATAASFQSVEWSPDGIHFAVAAADGYAEIFDSSAGRSARKFSIPNRFVSCAKWSGDGKRLAVAFGSDAPVAVSAGHAADVLAGRSGARPVVIWDAETGEQLRTLSGHTGAVDQVTWSPDFKRLASVGRDGTARIWDAATGEELLTLHGRGGQMLATDWSPDGRRLATGSRGSPGIQIWDAATGEGLHALALAGVRSVVWSPDGKRLASAHDDGTAVIWDSSTWEQLLVFRGHTAGVLQVNWNPDGLRILSVDREGLVKIWDPSDGRELLTFGKFGRAAWSPDGLRLVCVGNNPRAPIVIYDSTIGYAESRMEKSLAGLNRRLAGHTNEIGSLRRRAEVFAALGKAAESAADYERIHAIAAANAVLSRGTNAVSAKASR